MASSEEIYDAAVVLGCGASGEEPSYHTWRRLKVGLDLVLSGRVRCLMLAGSEGELKAMYRKAVECVSPLNIIVCSPSKTTIGNAYSAKIEAISRGFRKIVVVTSDFHIERALKIFETTFGNNYLLAYTCSRESAQEEVLKREERLKKFTFLLNLFGKGNHETIIRVARILRIEN